MGTPDFSVQILEKIIEAGHEVLLVVTQPDKPKGRGNTMQFPPVKECALAHGLPVFQPEMPPNSPFLQFCDIWTQGRSWWLSRPFSAR